MVQPPGKGVVVHYARIPLPRASAGRSVFPHAPTLRAGTTSHSETYSPEDSGRRGLRYSARLLHYCRRLRTGRSTKSARQPIEHDWMDLIVCLVADEELFRASLYCSHLISPPPLPAAAVDLLDRLAPKWRERLRPHDSLYDCRRVYCPYHSTDIDDVDNGESDDHHEDEGHVSWWAWD